MFSRFSRLFGNKVTEQDIRNWLNKNGYFGASADFSEIELHAIQRPGWYQIFRFSVKAKSISDEQWHELHGLLKDDERYRKNEVTVFLQPVKRDLALAECSKGMIVRRRRKR